jgi:hypothetical protein
MPGEQQLALTPAELDEVRRESQQTWNYSRRGEPLCSGHPQEPCQPQ